MDFKTALLKKMEEEYATIQRDLCTTKFSLEDYRERQGTLRGISSVLSMIKSLTEVDNKVTRLERNNG